MKKALSSDIRLWLKMTGFVMMLLTLARIIFQLVYPQFYNLIELHNYIDAWITGIRFDFATALITITIPFLLLWIPWPRKWYPTVAKVSAIASILMVMTAMSFIWADILYYEEAGHHLTFEVGGIKKDVWTMFVFVLTSYPIPCLILIAFWTFIAWYIYRMYRPLREEQAVWRKWWDHLLVTILALGISVIGIRGGLQVKPLRMTFAFSGDSVLGGHLALNGWYTFVATAFANEGKVKELLPDATAFKTIRQHLKSPWDTYLDDKYPLYRNSVVKSPIAEPGEKLNVVVLCVESLTAAYLKSFGGYVSSMPFLDSLAKQSFLVRNGYAIGTRSMEGLTAVFCSIPNLMGTPFMGSSMEQTAVRGMGTIFREEGYRTRFIHAARPGSMNIMQTATIAGYKDFLSQYDFDQKYFDGSWGIWDRNTLQRMSADLDSMPEPIHYAIFTMSTHSPYLLPPEFKKLFPDTMERAKGLNSFANFDLELRRFFEHEQQQPRFKRTIYAILGDHTSQVKPEGGVDPHFHIGYLIYAPGRLAPQVYEAPASQLDLLPSLLHLAGISTKQASFGRSLFDTTAVEERFAYFTQPGMVVWRTKDRILLNNLEQNIGLYDPTIDLHEKNNLLGSDSTQADSMKMHLYAYYQTAERLLIGNRVVPAILK